MPKVVLGITSVIYTAPLVQVWRLEPTHKKIELTAESLYQQNSRSPGFR